MPSTLHLKEAGCSHWKLAYGYIPNRIVTKQGMVSKIQFTNREEYPASCINCTDRPCCHYAVSEVSASSIPDFPADKVSNVCAVGAIEYNEKSGFPQIHKELCIACGVCMRRCPAGAISLLDGYVPYIETGKAKYLVGDASEKDHNETIALFRKTKRDGSCVDTIDSKITTLFERFQGVLSKASDRTSNILARNLLLAIGADAVVGRKGNNHIRMDIIYSDRNISQGVAEVEFGQEAVLNAPRDMLDSIAVLTSRYSWSKQQVRPIIITDKLPNRRSEYWHVIHDINQVLNIKIETVSIFALYLHLWKGSAQVLEVRNGFYFDKDKDSYADQVIAKTLGVRVPDSLRGLPEIDIAK